MKLSDPFNRVSCRQQTEYQKFQQQLLDSGIDTEEKARNVLRRSVKNMVNLGLFVILLLFGVILIWPSILGGGIIFGALMLLWLGLTILRGQRMLQRFIQQEFYQSGDQ